MSVFLLVPGTDHGPCRAPGNSESARSKVWWSKGTASRLPCLIFDEEEARPHYQTAAQERRPQQSSRAPVALGVPAKVLRLRSITRPLAREKERLAHIAELACGRSEAEEKSQELYN
jgi:hypothetical protein